MRPRERGVCGLEQRSPRGSKPKSDVHRVNRRSSGLTRKDAPRSAPTEECSGLSGTTASIKTTRLGPKEASWLSLMRRQPKALKSTTVPSAAANLTTCSRGQGEGQGRGMERGGAGGVEGRARRKGRGSREGQGEGHGEGRGRKGGGKGQEEGQGEGQGEGRGECRGRGRGRCRGRGRGRSKRGAREGHLIKLALAIRGKKLIVCSTMCLSVCLSVCVIACVNPNPKLALQTSLL